MSLLISILFFLALPVWAEAQMRVPGPGGNAGALFGGTPGTCLTVETCAWWFKADQISASNGSAVTTWSDQSGNGFDVTQVTSAKRPTYQTGILNGLPGVLFNPANGQALVGSGGALDITKNQGGVTIFVVAKLANASSATDAVGFLTGSGGDRAAVQTDGSNWRLRGRRLDADGGQNVPSDLSPTTSGLLITAIADWATGSARFYENTSLRTAEAAFQTSGNTSNTSSTGAWIGANAAASQGDYFDGYIFEVIVYQSALGNPDRDAVELALCTKWGLPC